MIYVTVNDKELGILFKHGKIVKETTNGPQTHPCKTTCSIFDAEVALGTGIVKLDSRDQFKYDKGRKLSLKGALAATGFDKEERTQVWKQFHAR